MRLIDADKIPWTDLNADMPNSKIKVLVTFAEKVNRMPTIEERKTGRWLDCSNGWMCSECDWTQTRNTKFCPNCGADMRTSE